MESKNSENTVWDDKTIKENLSKDFGVPVDELIESFKKNGFVVIPNVLSKQEVEECRNGLHADLLKMNVDYNYLKETCENLKQIQSHQSGGLHLYYSPWRLKHCALNEKLFHMSRLMWKETYATSGPGFECPHAPYSTDIGYSYLDSLNFRIPSELAGEGETKIQKSLGHHIDINPWDKWGGVKGKKRWRPFQGFISLTNHEGGFECCPGFHLELDQFFSNIPPPNDERGFIALIGKQYSSVNKRFRRVLYDAGAAVLWDWRLPHKIADKHKGPDTREVVYSSFLPDIPINQNYVKNQLEDIETGQVPPDFKRKLSADSKGQPVYTGYDPTFFENLTPIQKKMLGFESWEPKS